MTVVLTHLFKLLSFFSLIYIITDIIYATLYMSVMMI